MKTLIAKLAACLTIILFGLSPALVYAIDCNTCATQAGLSTQESVECGTSCASGNGSQTTKDAENNIDNTIANIINLLSVVVGIVAVVMIIIAGFRYITSAGDSAKVTGAKNTIMYAIIGLIIVALSQLIVKFVLDKATSPASAAKKPTSFVTPGSSRPAAGYAIT